MPELVATKGIGDILNGANVQTQNGISAEEGSDFTLKDAFKKAKNETNRGARRTVEERLRQRGGG